MFSNEIDSRPLISLALISKIFKKGISGILTMDFDRKISPSTKKIQDNVRFVLAKKKSDVKQGCNSATFFEMAGRREN